MKFYVSIAMISIALSGCVPQIPMIYVRTDGQRIAGNAALEQQGTIDKAICGGEVQKADLSGVSLHSGGFYAITARQERDTRGEQVRHGCMAAKGYVYVPLDKAEETRISFAETAKSRKAIVPK
jgi:hypothetical protein